MNDTELKEKVKVACDSMTRPKDLDARTMTYIKTNCADLNNTSNVKENKSQKVKRNKRKIFFKAAAACLALCLVLFGAWGVYNMPVAYADVESSAGVHLTINGIDRVIACDAINNEGQSALNELSTQGIHLQGMTYNEALDCLVNLDAFSKSDTSSIEVTIACDDETKCHQMQKSSEECLQNKSHNCTASPMEGHKCAQKQQNCTKHTN